MSILSRIFSDKKKPTPSKDAPEIIVAEFGKVIGTRLPAPTCVADVNELPYPKKEIRFAILVMLAATRDSKLQEHLQNAYLCLARWQEDVGPTRKGLDAIKLKAMIGTKSPQDLARETVNQGREWEKWQPIVKADTEALLNELKTARPGFGTLDRG